MIHPLSDCKSSNIGPNTNIWQFCVIFPGAKIGENCNICANILIENDVTIGNNVTVKSGVQLWDGTTLEDDVLHRAERDVHERLVPALKERWMEKNENSRQERRERRSERDHSCRGNDRGKRDGGGGKRRDERRSGRRSVGRESREVFEESGYEKESCDDNVWGRYLLKRCSPLFCKGVAA